MQQLKKDNYMVVGKSFIKFTTNPNIVSVDEVVSFFQPSTQREVGKIIMGQGLAIAEVKQLRVLRNIYSFELDDSIYHPADSKYTHKRKFENNLVTTPIKIDDHAFLSAISIFDGCAEISDHMTGHHVQGMVIMEASRQLFITTTEMFFIQPEDVGKYYYIFDGINTDFNTFVFPVAIDVFYRIISRKAQGKKQIFEVEMLFYQLSDTPVARSICRFSVVPKTTVEKLENRLAAQMANQALSGIDHRESIVSNNLATQM